MTSATRVLRAPTGWFAVDLALATAKALELLEGKPQRPFYLIEGAKPGEGNGEAKANRGGEEARAQ